LRTGVHVRYRGYFGQHILTTNILHNDAVLPFVAQRLCVAQLGLGTVFRRARLVLVLSRIWLGPAAGEVCGDAILS
jgi:hypothetical protein